MSQTPVTLLTGFLGAGKTTLLNRLLREPEMAGTAVLINEFGEIGLDHLLVERLDEDAVLLAAGCLCCTIRGDLSRALRDLAQRPQPIARVVIETTGLADPAPILQTLMSDPLLLRDYRLDGVVTLVDAVHGMATLDDQPEALRQAAVADRIVITKSDLADPAPLRARLAALNPMAPILVGEVSAAQLIHSGPFSSDGKLPQITDWIAASSHHHHHHQHDVNRHDARIRALCLRFEAPLPWEGLASYLEMMAMTQGSHMLRMKAVLNLQGQRGPVVMHGVQHSFHPPRMLESWPAGDDRSSRLVFILRDLDPRVVEDGLRAFLDAAA
ncbi:GTP-binding protein [Sediminicoccus sp. KRV36]|uniref:CobW family GTP-binding protein n=1 Tax=Sediminicoccus sp. KRV36 TaxID=3133721 RepID=UPI00200FD2B8|nr:GTP-binding protein [Sediminicoccus rosea]UPY35296.1 GTP-binding protein [Sediminicoccus rosea]